MAAIQQPRSTAPSSRFTAETRKLCCSVDRTAVLEVLGGTAVSELLRGEAFEVAEAVDGWMGGRCSHDGYPGFVRAHDLSSIDFCSAPTHRIIVRAGLVFAAPDIKSAALARPPMGSWLWSRGEAGAFVEVADGFVHSRHVRPAFGNDRDPVAVAQRLLDTPYLWGGRTGEGIDCSGLIQIALSMCGILAPRDTGPQSTALGRVVNGHPLERGDLVFFPGHVGLMVDGEHLLHANAYWMTTLIEPLADVIERLRPLHARPVRAVRRLNGIARQTAPG